MQTGSNHIISRFRWNTAFDQPEKATGLQDRLSSWSRTGMQQEILSVFDKVCPPGQTWRIDQLELNLGSINLNDLEFELALKLRQALNELLTDLVIHSNKAGRNNIEILDEDASHISLLRNYLLSGVMPWNHRPEEGSLNQLIAGQLQHNRRELIAMLRMIGAGDEQVRKRIAWQINDSSIIKIIEGLEPNNHTQVIDFSAEMVKIQMKETVVQASTADFRKNLWLWVLNYLLTERGTIFNKVAFMRSSIRQMAAYYNIAYAELLELIGRAVDVVSRMSGIRPDFIKTLQQLSGEAKNERQPALQRTEDDPELLRKEFSDLFRRPALRVSAEAKALFNELVTGLYRQDAQAFRALLLSFGNDAGTWSKVISDLDDAALETIVITLHAAKAEEVTESVYFLHGIGRPAGKAWKRRQLWKIAIGFLTAQKNTSFERAVFMEHCIAQLSGNNRAAYFQLLQQLVAANIPVQLKSIRALELYDTLNASFIATVAQQDTAFIKENTERLLHTFIHEANAGITDKMAFSTLRKLLVKSIQSQPRQALELLMTYAGKAALAEALPYLLDEYTAKTLLRQAPQHSITLVNVIMQAAAEWKAIDKTAVLITVLEEVLPFVAIRQLVLHTSFSSLHFVEELLSELFENTAVTGSNRLHVFTELLFRDERLTALGISKPAADTLLRNYINGKRTTFSEQVRLLKTATAAKQVTIAQSLRTKLAAANLSGIAALPATEKETLLETLVAGSTTLMRSLIKEYGFLLKNEFDRLSETEIIKKLTQLYWKTILNDKLHKGRKENLVRAFREAVAYTYFSPEEKRKKITGDASGVHPSSKNIFLKNGMPLSAEQLEKLIREAIAAGTEEIEYRGTILRLDDLLSAAKEQSTNNEQLRALLQQAGAQRLQNGGLLSFSEMTGLIEKAFIKGEERIVYEGTTFQLQQLLAMAMRQPVTVNLRPGKNSSTKSYRLKNGNELPAAFLPVLLEACFTTTASFIEKEQWKIRKKELLLLALENTPATLREALAGSKASTVKKMRVLQAAVSFHTFSSHIFSDQSGTKKEVLEALRQLYNLVMRLAPAALLKQLLKDSWQLALQLIIAPVNDPVKTFHTIAETVFQQLAKENNIQSAQLIREIEAGHLQLTPLMATVMSDLYSTLSAAGIQQWSKAPAAALQKAERENALEAVCIQLITNKSLPSWYEAEESAESVLNALILYYPVIFVHVIRRETISEAQFNWLHRSIALPQLMHSIGSLHKEKQSLLTVTEELYRALGRIAVKGISAAALQYLLFRKVLKAWSSGNWRLLAPEQLWNELMWDAQTKYGVAKKDFLQGIGAAKLTLPLSAQITLGLIKDSSNSPKPLPPRALEKPVPKLALQLSTTASRSKGAIPVKNAGMVLISSYIQILFDRLGITAERKFTSGKAKLDAPHYLQYVATGMLQTEEGLLPLNKVLCGMALQEPLREGIEITDEHKVLINGLLNAMISYWPAIGNTSVNGFRGNWLVRDGLLTELEDKWELTVEKRAYDVLIHQSPFSFSIIKLPWMEKPLHVTWPY